MSDGAESEKLGPAYSYAELAAMFHVKPRTLRLWRKQGKLEPVFATGGRTTRLRIVTTPNKAAA